jgi:uncharacterized protein YraI
MLSCKVENVSTVSMFAVFTQTKFVNRCMHMNSFVFAQSEAMARALPNCYSGCSTNLSASSLRPPVYMSVQVDDAQEQRRE